MKRAAEINVTPLVDVCLVLLIIFMAASRVQYGYDAATPREHRVIDSPVREIPVVVSLKLNGDVLLDRERVEPGLLVPRLKAVLANRKSRLAFFASADGATYGAAMAVVDQMNRAGAKIGIATNL